MALLFPNAFDLVPKGEEIKRCGMVVGVELNGTVLWIGKDIEGSDLTPNYNDKVVETIWCESIDKSTVGALTMTLDPFGLVGTGTPSGGTEVSIGEFQAQLLEALMSKNLQGMVAPAVVGYAIAGKVGTYRAKRYAESTWKPTALGGTGTDKILKFPLNVTFAGTETIGAVDKLPPKDLTAKFTADPAA